ncbi:putative MFS family arabinose efflux permease [Tumebacillus sp. BK434]|uniref:MFS transporter n=1 Tax=Tumebacillus sp. BK434 TaxID=2512169 RepID=UPI00104E6B4E|nr:MFS transporter [Tumebacillus sp. BK434]TCP52528.1 putative MFS family arabinose efflux permease [Tumebacillus sp. BK434]
MQTDWRIPFQNRGFAWLFGGQLITALGTWSSYILIPLLVYRMTGDPVAVGILISCRLLPLIVLAPLVGKVIGQRSLLRVMIESDLVRAVAMLGFLWIDTPLYMYLLTIVISSATAFFNPGKFALIPSLVPQEVLARANSYIGAANQLMMLIGPALGGVTFAFFGMQAGIVFSALTFLVSALMLMRIKVRKAPSAEMEGEERQKRTWRQQAAILQKLWSRKMLFFLLLGTMISNLGYGGALNALFPVLAEDLYADAEIAYGYIMSALGGGLMLGTLLGPNLQKRFAPLRVYAVAMVAASMCVLGFGSAQTLWAALPLVFMLGIGNGLEDNASVTYVQQETASTGDTADVFSVDQALASIGTITGMALATTFAALFDAHQAVQMLSLCPFAIGILIGLLQLMPDRAIKKNLGQ